MVTFSMPHYSHRKNINEKHQIVSLYSAIFGLFLDISRYICKVFFPSPAECGTINISYCTCSTMHSVLKYEKSGNSGKSH